MRIGREEGVPTVIFLHQHHADDAAHRSIGRRKSFVRLGHRFAIDRAIDGLPASLLSGALGQREFVFPIFGRQAPASGCDARRPLRLSAHIAWRERSRVGLGAIQETFQDRACLGRLG